MSVVATEHKKEFCPYWSGTCQECRMAKGGVYLPMPEHVGLFCCTKSFIQCHQYILGCGVIREVVEQYRSLEQDNRRKFSRVKEEVPLSISVNSATGCADAPELISAITLDMSLDGMRIQTQVALPAEEQVFFEFDNEFSVPNWKGMAQVRWSKKAHGADLFEAGMAIVDNESFHAIGQHIGVPGFPSVA